MEVNAYLKRIGYSGPINNTYATLKLLCECHLNTIPFDTLDMFGGDRKKLQLEKIYRNIVVNHRGGFCCENNGLFCWLLQNFGFEVQVVQAQTFSSGKFNNEFEHMALLVISSDGKVRLTDVGWGGDCYKVPLEFIENLEQAQENGVFRITRPDGDKFIVQRQPKAVINMDGSKRKAKEEKWQTMYRFDCIPRKLSDFELMCDYVQDDDDGFLKRNTLCSLFKPGGAVVMWGSCFREKKYVDPMTEKIVDVTVCKDQDELKKLVKKHFGFDLMFEVKVESKDQYEIVV